MRARTPSAGRGASRTSTLWSRLVGADEVRVIGPCSLIRSGRAWTGSRRIQSQMPWNRMRALTRWVMNRWVAVVRSRERPVAGSGTPRVVATMTRSSSRSRPTVTLTRAGSTRSRMS